MMNFQLAACYGTQMHMQERRITRDPHVALTGWMLLDPAKITPKAFSSLLHRQMPRSGISLYSSDLNMGGMENPSELRI